MVFVPTLALRTASLCGRLRDHAEPTRPALLVSSWQPVAWCVSLVVRRTETADVLAAQHRAGNLRTASALLRRGGRDMAQSAAVRPSTASGYVLLTIVRTVHRPFAPIDLVRTRAHQWPSPREQSVTEETSGRPNEITDRLEQDIDIERLDDDAVTTVALALDLHAC